MPRFLDETLLIATHNEGKAREISDLLQSYVPRFVTAGSLGLCEPEETGSTFSENAVLKARCAAQSAKMLALADDSGLCVHALGGEPGIYSARWAGPQKDFMSAMQRVHDALGDSLDRSASFICVLALAWPDGHTKTFEGRIDGTLIWPPRGEKGFGYDPFFVPNGYLMSFAEMDPMVKHQMSHRAQAFDKLVEYFFSKKRDVPESSSE